MTSSEDLALLNIDVVNDEAPPPFYISEAEKRDLRTKGEQLVPALVINPLVGTFDDFIPQMMIPPIVMDLARKAKGLRLTTAEIEAIREIIRPGSGLLRQILELKIKGFHKIPPDASHPPYIRVACTGIGDYDGLVPKGPNDDESGHEGTYGSPAVLEIWPAQHFSPIHSHGGTTGIMYCLAGEIDVMSYQSLGWDAKKWGW
jgi:hypothetical protein